MYPKQDTPEITPPKSKLNLLRTCLYKQNPLMYKQVQAFVLIASLIVSVSSHAQVWHWAKKAGGNGNVSGGSIDIDKDGNSYIAGTFFNSVTLGSTTLAAPGLNAVFIARYDINGNLVWAKVAASAAAIDVHGICVDKSGHISVTGMFVGTGVFGATAPVSVVSTGDFDVFVARYSATGDIVWAHNTGDIGFDYAGAISHDHIGNVYVTG